MRVQHGSLGGGGTGQAGAGGKGAALERAGWTTQLGRSAQAVRAASGTRLGLAPAQRRPKKARASSQQEEVVLRFRSGALAVGVALPNCSMLGEAGSTECPVCTGRRLPDFD